MKAEDFSLIEHIMARINVDIKDGNNEKNQPYYNHAWGEIVKIIKPLIDPDKLKDWQQERQDDFKAYIKKITGGIYESD